MSKIKKELKTPLSSMMKKQNLFTIIGADELYSTVELNKVYAFAFMRFVIRMAQRNWLMGQKGKPKKLILMPHTPRGREYRPQPNVIF
jgi:hypothetical protein